MSRRKGEITSLLNERDFRHLVELALPSGGFRSQMSEFETFHRERRISVRRGRNRHDAERLFIRFFCSDAATADAFRSQFRGERMTYAPERARPRHRL